MVNMNIAEKIKTLIEENTEKSRRLEIEDLEVYCFTKTLDHLTSGLTVPATFIRCGSDFTVELESMEALNVDLVVKIINLMLAKKNLTPSNEIRERLTQDEIWMNGNFNQGVFMLNSCKISYDIFVHAEKDEPLSGFLHIIVDYPDSGFYSFSIRFQNEYDKYDLINNILFGLTKKEDN